MKPRVRINKRSITTVAVLALAYSAFQFLTTGTVSWPQQLLSSAGDSVKAYPQREDASWRKAAGKVEQLGAAREGKPSSFGIVGKVVRVADGDTVSVLDSTGQQHKIRLFGIDSPERDQPHGPRAGKTLAKMVNGKQVGIAIVEKDDYGRTVGTVFLQDENINAAMIEAGYAWWYRYHAPRERHLEAAEQRAKAAQRGLWADPSPIPPWNWRRGRR